MNRDYSHAEKRIWTDKYVHEHYAYDKNNAGYVNVGSFPQQIWCHCKLRKCVKAMCKCTKSCNNTTYFCLKMRLNRKGKVRNFLWHAVILFTKFEQYNTAFQSLFSEIIRIWELFFRSVGSYFSFKLLLLQLKTALPTSRNQFLLTIRTYCPYIWQKKLNYP